MADFDTVQSENAVIGTQVEANEWGGRVRVAWFETQATWAPAQNDRLKLAVLPDRSRVLRGRVDFGAFGSGVTLDIGDDADEDRYAAAVAVATAGQADFANTAALGMGHEISGSNQRTLWAKFEGANPTDNIALKGYVLYVID